MVVTDYVLGGLVFFVFRLISRVDEMEKDIKELKITLDKFKSKEEPK